MNTVEAQKITNFYLSFQKFESYINLKEKVDDVDKMGIIDPLDPNETRVVLAVKSLKFEDTMSNIERKNRDKAAANRVRPNEIKRQLQSMGSLDLAEQVKDQSADVFQVVQV
jgi:hypothetical protein